MTKKDIIWLVVLLASSVLIGRLWMMYHDSLHAGRQAGLTDADLAGFKEYPRSDPAGAPGTAGTTIKDAGMPKFPVGTPPVRLLAAASTADALTTVCAEFTRQTGVEVRVSSGGSNVLAQQIVNGAPVDLFLFADEASADVVTAKRPAVQRVDLVGNRLVLVVSTFGSSEIRTPQDLTGPHLKHLALAGESVPAGRYAGQALEHLGLLKTLREQNRIVRGGDVRVAFSYVLAGEAEAGIVYASDAATEAHPRGKGPPRLAVVYTFPDETHDPIRYPLVLLSDHENAPAAEALYRFLCGPEARLRFELAGFTYLPGQAASGTRGAGASGMR
ncbi:MAG TPA: molybdate ABC transporter substrate-binding protein [Planctomycetota bacterium]|nr:molybdate ABC transporter substrate-binding protein [Planctomycetota bacterium]